MHAGRELAGEPIFHETQQPGRQQWPCPLSAAVENSNDTVRGDVELVEQIGKITPPSASRILPFRRTHAQMLEVIACLLRMVSRCRARRRRWPPSRFRTQGAHALDLLWQHHIVMQDVGITKERRLRLPRSPTVPGEPGARVGSRFRRPAYSSTMICRCAPALAGTG